MAAVAADVPSKWDVVINGQGYTLLDALAPNIPFRTHRAIYTYSPTFLERTNVKGNYGDDAQSFWLTASQNNWLLGEEQHFLRSDDADSVRKYWKGSNIDISSEGKVKLIGAVITAAPGASVGGAIYGPGGANAYVGSATRLYDIDGAGTVTDKGAHGAAISDVSNVRLATDGSEVYISGDGSATVRKWNGAAFSTFSATPNRGMCFVSNTLWGTDGDNLIYYDTAGVASTAFQWEDADGGTTFYGRGAKILPFGGRVLILRPGIGHSPVELWTADTTGATQIAAFPAGFISQDLAVVNGIVFVLGTYLKKNFGYRTEVWYYANGNIGKAYSGETYAASTRNMAICEFDQGFAFLDGPNQRVMRYNLVDGGVSTIATYTQPALGHPATMAPNNSGLLITNDTTSPIQLPGTVAATSGYIITSLLDFDSSLTKTFRSIAIDWTPGTSGAGGSIDVAYRVGDLDGSYTTLATGVTSGAENLFGSVVQGRSISVKVTLNATASNDGPTVKRIYVRCAPQLQQYRRREYILDLTGAKPDRPRMRRDGIADPTEPFDGITNLVTALSSTSPISITDRFGTFTGIIEPDGTEFYEMHEQQERQTKSGSFVAKVIVREI